MENRTTTYLVLFCALVAARAPRINFQQALAVAPLAGGARLLAAELTQPLVPVADGDPAWHSAPTSSTFHGLTRRGWTAKTDRS
jgi:hypothetical protein